MDTEFEGLNIAEITGATVQEAFAQLEPKINKVLDEELADWSKKQSVGAPAKPRRP